MKRIIIPILLFVSLVTAVIPAVAQTRYLVRLKNKGGSSYTLSNPSAYLSQRSLERRTRYGIPLDSTDLPVPPSYINQIENVPNVTVLNVSRWLNQVSIQLTDADAAGAALATINSFPFVQSSTPIAARTISTTGREVNKKEEETFTPSTARMTGVQANYYNYGNSIGQVRIHNGAFLHNIGLRGQTMVVGMLDAGFSNYLTVSGFDSIRTRGQVLGTWDFVARNADVNDDNAHGTGVLSTIATNLPGQMVGTAPGASFYLYRTEDGASEYPIEEHNWVCGAERVDSAGGDLINSSLGYNEFDDPRYNHTYADMNGNTTMAAIGADLAAKKGLLVVNSAGNSGNDSWQYIITPADGDSVLAVGGVNKDSVYWTGSSRGPSSDGQVKPDVASVGAATVLQNASGNIVNGWGTSFAAPNMTGLAACLWQGFRELNNMRIISALRRSGHQATNPDERMGYGIPDMKKAVLLLLKEVATSSATINNCKTVLSWTSKDVETMKYEIERKTAGDSAFTKIGERFGTGSTFASHTYTYTDTISMINAGSIAYRIRQVIDTAAAGFSADYIDTATVQLATSCVSGNSNLLVVTPNPAPQGFVVKVVLPDAIPQLEIRIADVLGRTVSKIKTSKPAGTASFPLTNANLAKGTYYVSVYGNGKLLGTQKMLKL